MSRARDLSRVLNPTAAELSDRVLEPVDDYYGIANVLDFGTNTTPGVTDMSAAFNAAIATGRAVFAPEQEFKVNNLNSLGVGQRMFGAGRKTILRKGANGPVATMGKDSRIDNLQIYGESALYTGNGINIPATVEFEGRQQISHVKIVDTAGYCVEYTAEYAGFYSCISFCELDRASSSLPAVKWGVETASNHHGNRAMVHVVSNGPLVDASGSQNGKVIACNSGGGGDPPVVYSATSAKIIVADSRLIGPVTMLGTSHTFTGNVTDSSIAVDGDTSLISGNYFAGGITLGAASVNNKLDGNEGAITDNSTGLNDYAVSRTSYTPVWTSSGTAPSIGAGNISGTWSRQGRTITAQVTMNLGAGLSVGTGNYFFSLPKAPGSGFYTGAARLFRSGVDHVLCLVTTISDTTALCQVYAPTGGLMSATVPAPLISGDALSFSLTYDL